MKFLRLLAIYGGLLCFGHAYGGPSALTTAQLYIDGHTCSGTIVAPSTILSAAHCFKEEVDPIEELFGHPADPAPPPTYMTVDGYKVFIEAITYDDADHALVKVIFVFKDHAELAHQRPDVGGKIHYWGNAAKQNNTYREGYVTSYVKGEMVMDVNGFFGDSGAGIFDESGKVAGVMSYLGYHPHQGLVFKLMGAYPLEFTPLQYSMMGVTAP
jgi:V8-like Glu-specific endopeptidase